MRSKIIKNATEKQRVGKEDSLKSKYKPSVAVINKVWYELTNLQDMYNRHGDVFISMEKVYHAMYDSWCFRNECVLPTTFSSFCNAYKKTL